MTAGVPTFKEMMATVEAEEPRDWVATIELAMQRIQQEMMNLDRCEVVTWGDGLGECKLEDAPDSWPLEVECLYCRAVQPTPTRAQPSCLRCGTWLLKNQAL